MRKHLHIHLNDRTIREEKLEGEQIARAGRYLIAKTLVEREIYKVDPLSPENPLIFSAGPFAGSNFSNANRTSVGCRSPLTGGVKEANGGGSFGVALGHQGIAGFTLHGAASEWVVIHLRKDGTIQYADATPYLGKGNFEAARLLHARYGDKVSLALCGTVGEYQGLIAGIAFSDVDNRPSRLAARGGVGAVMGSKKVKAIVVDLDRMPVFHDRKKLIESIRTYANWMKEDSLIAGFRTKGTAMMADFTNHIGGLPVNNFTGGQQAGAGSVFKMGAEFITTRNAERGGENTHACMPGCLIQCSNVYADAEGREVVSPVEYETICLMGTNLGIDEPDDLARLNFLANDLGVDSIETGATLGLLLEAGMAKFGDVDFLLRALEAIRQGTPDGRRYAQGAARVGEELGLARVPVIKRQAISAYDPRVIEVTGLSMMLSAQGADHTVGNVPAYDCKDKDARELVGVSLDSQIMVAATDSLGLCLFGRTVTNTHQEFIINAIAAATGVDPGADFMQRLGRETLRYEAEFNRAAGFTEADDELPEFFYSEPLPPTGKTARYHGPEANAALRESWGKIGR
ncbi:MAG: aldehyde ferredoxin oxidoreductase [Gammaproteobacteria bacterium]|nr:MAG: aldehyde ferredoxin oxidoreductase [Gammaproteobacteria bacterium]